jgi:hypothetical protein
VIYYGLADTWDLDEDASIYMDANLELEFNMANYKHEQNLIDMVALPLCSDYLTADGSNQYGDCPADGTYAFNTNYMLPAIDNSMMDWAASGWAGVIEIDMYIDGNQTQLLGKCSLSVTTLVTGSYESGAFSSTPSAKTAALGILGVLVALLVFCAYCCCCRRKNKDENPNTFTRMNGNGDLVI